MKKISPTFRYIIQHPKNGIMSRHKTLYAAMLAFAHYKMKNIEIYDTIENRKIVLPCSTNCT